MNPPVAASSRLASSPLRLLARAEALRLRTLGLIARGDPAFLFAALVGVLVACAAARGLVERLQASAPAAALASLACGASVFTGLFPHPGRRARVEMTQGPFQPWLADRSVLKQWLLIRTAAPSFVVITLCAGVVASVRITLATPFVLLAGVGATVAALACLSRPDADSQASNEEWTAPRRRATALLRPAYIRPAAWLVSAAALRRPAGPFAAWASALCLLVLGAAVGGLAARNNDAPAAGAGIVTAAAVLAGLTAGPPDLVLLRLMGRQPIGLAALLLNFLPAAPAAAAGAFLGCCAARLPLGLAGASAAAALVLVGGWLLLVLLHGLGKPAAHARIAAGLDVTVALLMLSLMAPLAPLYLLGRTVLLVRADRVQRWREA